ncbi:golgin subfamily A member 6-like protein 7 [Manduca sexta]|uniref:golgin subfamily A member 6-like protein 7 n=1 Tax=Manduca sexta TaxID=7130 RepID=UPI00188E8A12|nr:golgin subfamily A member 6-like protein 7 [Manduca sexta]
MEKTQDVFTIENFLSNWNGYFSDCQLTAADLKTPHAVMGALFQIIGRLGIDIDAVLAPPPQDMHNDNTMYYWDLLPVINMTRVINYLVLDKPASSCQVFTASIINLLQPTAATSHSILALMYNLMLFNEDKLGHIAPHEQELFEKTNQVKALEDHKNKLLVRLNEQAEEKGKRAQRLETHEQDIQQFEEELKQEKEIYDEEKQELEALIKEKRQIDMLLEQKKGHRDALLAEIARNKALRVYDAEDIKAQVEQVAQNVKEAEEKLENLRATLMQKENSLKNLQTVKPSLDVANNLLHDIMKLSDSLKDIESGDLDSDSKEGELEVLSTELSELQVQLCELQTARHEASLKRQEAQAKRHEEKTFALSALREAEEKDKKSRERSKKDTQRTEEIKELLTKYEAEKSKGIEELLSIKNKFCAELKSADDILLKKAMEVEKRIGDKLRHRRS